MMKTAMKKLLALALSLGLLTACGPKEPVPEHTPDPEVTAAPAETPAPTETPAAEADIRVALLRDPIGLAAAALMDGNRAGRTGQHYAFTVHDSPEEAADALSRGLCDVAALPTSLASVLYHRDRNIQLLGLSGAEPLCLLERGNRVHSLSDLTGLTVAAAGESTDARQILRCLLETEEAGQVTVRWMEAEQAAEAVRAGEADLCLLPEPDAAAVLLEQEDFRPALRLSEEWVRAGADGIPVPGCVVVRTAFAQAHPEAVELFLTEYAASAGVMSDGSDPTAAAGLAEAYGFVPEADIAGAILPEADLSLITGDDMIAEVQGYYGALYSMDPASIGGSIPDGAFYYESR